MINNLIEYFEPQQEFYLDKVVYNRVEDIENVKQEDSEYTLKCVDNITTSIDHNDLKIIVQRQLEFYPEGIFDLTVAFGANLKFVESKMGDYDWNQIDLSNEFRINGGFVIVNLMSRISMLVANITSSFGQAPIVLPPGVNSSNME